MISLSHLQRTGPLARPMGLADRDDDRVTVRAIPAARSRVGRTRPESVESVSGADTTTTNCACASTNVAADSGSKERGESPSSQGRPVRSRA